MSENIKMTKLASCAGCGAKVGAGMLVKILDHLPVRKDERLIVGYDKKMCIRDSQITTRRAVRTLNGYAAILCQLRRCLMLVVGTD